MKRLKDKRTWIFKTQKKDTKISKDKKTCRIDKTLKQ